MAAKKALGEGRIPEINLDLNEPGLAGWRSFLQAHFRILRVLQTEMAVEQGLELAEYVALFNLYMAGDHSMRMGELADLTFRSRSAMTRVVDRLEQGGFVVRKTDPDNQRSKLAVLTPAGLLQLRQAFPIHHHRLTANVTKRLTPDEWETLRGLMDRLG